jgi:hypothetical protein
MQQYCLCRARGDPNFSISLEGGIIYSSLYVLIGRTGLMAGTLIGRVWDDQELDGSAGILKTPEENGRI